MYLKDVTVKNQVGLHARPATFFRHRLSSKTMLSLRRILWAVLLWSPTASTPGASVPTPLSPQETKYRAAAAALGSAYRRARELRPSFDRAARTHLERLRALGADAAITNFVEKG